MASPLDALGAAAAIAQFTQYGVKLTMRAVEMYRSADGSTREMAEIERMTNSTQDLHDRMLAQLSQRSEPLTEDEKALKALAASCGDVATELLNFINDNKPQGKARFVKSLYAAQKYELHRNTLAGYRRSLEDLGQQLSQCLLKIISDQQYELASTFHTIERQNVELEDRVIFQLQKQKEELKKELKQLSSADSKLAQKLLGLQQEGRLVLRRQKILSSLRFDSLQSRQEQIVEASRATYDWVFDPKVKADAPPVNYVNWLKRGDDIYWITGKAGSGKSTLMKYICGHLKTLAALRGWSAGHELYVASFYFFNAGTRMQKSQQGLLQSLLFKLLCQCPDAIERTCMKRWAVTPAEGFDIQPPWTFTELEEAITALSSSVAHDNPKEPYFCFFVDGLDEYDGEHEELIQLIWRLSKRKNIKICASSRPWEVFVDSFARSAKLGNRLDLHLYTKDDIANFVNERLGPHLSDKRKHDLKVLADEITETAKGVFLWVSLVLKELIRGLHYYDDMESLRSRLKRIPKGLTKYFEDIFQNIDPFYEKDTARIFKACVGAQDLLPMNIFDIIISDDPEKRALDASAYCHYEWDTATMKEAFRKRLNGRCLDLLELDSSAAPDSGRSEMSNIVFLHRTVVEFLESTTLSQRLNEMAGQNFKAHVSLAAGYLFLIKKRMSLHTHIGDRSERRWMEFIFEHGKQAEKSQDTLISRILLDLDHVITQRSFMHGDSREDIRNRALMANVVYYGLCRNLEDLVSTHNRRMDEDVIVPYLTYALRRPIEDIEKDMVLLLLSWGYEVNQASPAKPEWTVWEQFLRHSLEELADQAIFEPAKVSSFRTFSSTTCFPKLLEITWVLIDHGAQHKDEIAGFFNGLTQMVLGQSLRYAPKHMRDIFPVNSEADVFSTHAILQRIFGLAEAQKMSRAMNGEPPLTQDLVEDEAATARVQGQLDRPRSQQNLAVVQGSRASPAQGWRRFLPRW